MSLSEELAADTAAHFAGVHAASAARDAVFTAYNVARTCECVPDDACEACAASYAAACAKAYAAEVLAYDAAFESARKAAL